MELASIFCDGMVLQANKPIYLYGYGKGTVKAEFCGKTYEKASDAEKWVMELSPQAYGDRLEMVVSLNDEEIKIKNVSVGEVFLVAGQSNAQMRVGEEICADEDYEADENLRVFTVTRPERDEVAFKESDGWQTANKNSIKRFSAVGYHTGAELRKKLGCTVGIVGCFQGASVIQSWMEKSMGEKFDLLTDTSERKRYSARVGYFWNENGFLYDSMFKRVVPYAFSNVIWYQGESNSYLPEAAIYGEMLKALILRWREQFFDKDLAVTVIVICDMVNQGEGFTAVQEEQRRFTGTLKNVSVIESSDVCEHSSIHPNDKRALSVRIADTILKGRKLNG